MSDFFESTQTTDSGKLSTQIVSLQHFDGTWEESALIQIISNNPTTLIMKAKPSQYNSKVWTTAIVIGILAMKCANSITSWEIVANKAKSWIIKYLFAQEKVPQEKLKENMESVLAKAEEVLKGIEF